MTNNEKVNEQYTSLVAESKEELNSDLVSRALDTLNSAYQLQQTEEVNHLLATTLVAQGQFQEAQTIADEYLSSYAKDEQSARIYLDLSLHNHYFLNAWEFLTWLAEGVQEKLQPKVVDAENSYRLSQEKTIRTIARQFYHLSDGNTVEQQKRLLAANKLPLNDYLIGAKFVLRDPFLSQISRTAVLDQLRRLRIKEPVEFLDLDGHTQTYIPASLTALKQNEIYNNILNELDKYAKTLGTVMVHGLSDKVHLLLMLVYQELSTAVQDATSWVDGLVAETFGYPMPNES